MKIVYTPHYMLLLLLLLPERGQMR